MTQDHIIKAAEQAGFANQYPTAPMLEMFERFYAIAFRQGMDRAAEKIETTKEWRGGKWTSTLCPLTTEAIADAIRAEAHAQNQLKNVHDTGNVSKN